jgi:hypothetical protein
MEKIDPRFAETEFVVEATSFEKLTLWSQHSTHGSIDCVASWGKPYPRFEWVQDNPGADIVVGQIYDEDVRITVFWDIIGGMRVAFWNPCSNMFDRRMAKRWLEANCSPKWDGSRLAHTNAMNFHHVIQAIWDKYGGRSSTG